MIKLNKVSKKYKYNTIFENINVNFEKGKKILIKGSNGQGKSVLLKLIVGYSYANEGQIIVDDYILKKDYDFIRNAGVSINAPEFNKNLSGLENLEYLASIRKVASKQDINKLVNYFDMQENIKKKYKTYSLGMKQKMRLIQALMDKPEYLILDEPFDGLDQESQKKAIDLLNAYMNNKPDTTLIYTTHNEKFQGEFADQIFEIEYQNIQRVK